MRGLSVFKHLIVRGIISVLVLLSVPFAIINQANAQSADPESNGRLVTFHDRGEDRVILTYAQTVRDAVDDADIVLANEDIVEPGLDEPLVAADYTINIYRARPVIIDDGALRVKVMTAAQTPEAIMKDVGIELHDEDLTSISPSTDIVTDGAGEILTVDRATEFTLDLYGTKDKVYTHEDTVGAMLQAKDIELGEKDRVAPSEQTPMTRGMTVTVWREGKQTKTVREKIAFTVRQIQDVDQPIGYSKIKTQGVDGSKNVTYQITIKNGKEVARKAIQTVVLEQPQEQVEIVGAKGTFDGSFAEALARLRSCEGSYTSNTGNGYYGAYQFDIGTWGGYKGYPNAAAAPPAVQDEKAWETYQRRGWQPWPSCSRSMGLQDIYR